MADKSYEIEKVIDFLKKAQGKGVLNFNTARTRVTAIKKLSNFLSEAENNDIRNINKVALAEKVRNAGQINEGTLQTYLTRLDKSIEAYTSLYEVVEDSGEANVSDSHQKMMSFKKDVCHETTLAVEIDGAIVRVNNLPVDITIEQVDKICRALHAFVDI